MPSEIFWSLKTSSSQDKGKGDRKQSCENYSTRHGGWKIETEF